MYRSGFSGLSKENISMLIRIIINAFPKEKGDRVSTSTRWALGTSGGRSGRARCQQRQADEVKASGMSGSLQRQLVGCEYLISSGFQALFSVERGWDLGGILKRR